MFLLSDQLVSKSVIVYNYVSFPHEAIRALDFFQHKLMHFPISQVAEGHKWYGNAEEKSKAQNCLVCGKSIPINLLKTY